MRLSVAGGTVSSNADMCASCVYAIRLRAVNNATYTKCTQIGIRINHKIAECTQYNPLKQPHGMFYKLAWGYNRNVNTGIEEFNHPQDLSWATRLPPPPKPMPIIIPVKKTWRQKLRSKTHSLLDIILRPITKGRR